MEEDESLHTNPSKCCVVCRFNRIYLWRIRILRNCLIIFSGVSDIHSYYTNSYTNSSVSPASASVIGLYTSYAAPIFLRITSGRNKFTPGPFNLGRWAIPIGTIAVTWVCYIIVLLFFPPGQTTTAQGMSEWDGTWPRI